MASEAKHNPDREHIYHVRTTKRRAFLLVHQFDNLNFLALNVSIKMCYSLDGKKHRVISYAYPLVGTDSFRVRFPAGKNGEPLVYPALAPTCTVLCEDVTFVRSQVQPRFDVNGTNFVFGLPILTDGERATQMDFWLSCCLSLYPHAYGGDAHGWRFDISSFLKAMIQRPEIERLCKLLPMRAGLTEPFAFNRNTKRPGKGDVSKKSWPLVLMHLHEPSQTHVVPWATVDPHVSAVYHLTMDPNRTKRVNTLLRANGAELAQQPELDHSAASDLKQADVNVHSILDASTPLVVACAIKRMIYYTMWLSRLGLATTGFGSFAAEDLHGWMFQKHVDLMTLQLLWLQNCLSVRYTNWVDIAIARDTLRAVLNDEITGGDLPKQTLCEMDNPLFYHCDDYMHGCAPPTLPRLMRIKALPLKNQVDAAYNNLRRNFQTERYMFRTPCDLRTHSCEDVLCDWHHARWQYGLALPVSMPYCVDPLTTRLCVAFVNASHRAIIAPAKTGSAPQLKAMHQALTQVWRRDKSEAFTLMRKAGATCRSPRAMADLMSVVGLDPKNAYFCHRHLCGQVLTHHYFAEELYLEEEEPQQQQEEEVMVQGSA